MQHRILLILHANHIRISRMKAIACSYFWWFELFNEIERQAKSYLVCQTIKPTTQLAPLHPRVWPEAPWRRIHINFAAPFMLKMFFVVVDAHSK